MNVSKFSSALLAFSFLGSALGCGKFAANSDGPALSLSLITCTDAEPCRTRLSWKDNSENEIGFNIERRIVGSAEGFQPLTQTAANVEGYEDLGIEAGKTYCYRLNAFNAAAISEYTSEACGQIVDSKLVRLQISDQAPH